MLLWLQRQKPRGCLQAVQAGQEEMKLEILKEEVV